MTDAPTVAVILNGPPQCGKDTLAVLMESYGFVHRSFKDTLYEETAGHFQIDLKDFIERATDREKKEQPWEALGGLTPREALIFVNEVIIKPNYGNDYFGKSAVAKCIIDPEPLVVFSDGGFDEEIEPLFLCFEHVVIFRLFRQGCSFDEDSRSYLTGFDGQTFDVELVTGNPGAGLDTIMGHLELFIGSV